MHWASGGLLSLFLLFSVNAFALNLDSLPVWDPAYLVRGETDSYDGSKAPFAGEFSALESSSRIETHGYKTMQVTVGDGGTQVDQELRLSIQGMVGDSVYIDALLSDVDRKAGDQTTATLQDVDQIYFRAQSRHWMIHLGDLTWKDENMGLFSMTRSTLGAMAGLRAFHTEVRGAIGTDEVNRKTCVMNGVSGQREGYAVDDDGDYLAIVPESESVWLNGVLLSRGKDYDMNYAGGLLNFRGRITPGPDDEIRVEYDSYEDDEIYNLYAANAKYRHPNLYLDVSGFRLENDRDRLRRGVWTDEDYKALKSDGGGKLYRYSDSLPMNVDSTAELNRPERFERVGARLRMQGDHRYYADMEIAMNRRDSNTVSDDIEGPEGKAYRWYLTTDSTEMMRKFPVAFSVYGNYLEEGFDGGIFQGSDMDWNSYKLKDEWDLDSSRILSGDLRHDEFGMRLRLGSGWFTNALWGYRQNDDESWNSSRAKVSLTHKTDHVTSDVGLARVVSEQNGMSERYQTFGKVEYLQGLIRPFGNFDLRYTDSEDSLSVEQEVAYGDVSSGFLLVADHWEGSEEVETKLSKRRGDEFGEDWTDSLKSFIWTQSLEFESRFFEVSHLLQYERRKEDSSGIENNWMGELNGRFGQDEIGISGNVDYKLGMTEEQTYTAIYKAVAPGTGDVRYDSLTGAFIEGVDNGNFVYEGMGRNDSVGAVLASDASFGIDVDVNPGILFGIRQGFLRDVTLGGAFNAESEDTTGKRLYFPASTPHQLRKVSSGSVSWEARARWSHSLGFSFGYTPGADYDKKLSSTPYFEKRTYHDFDMDFRINENHLVGGTALFENQELRALQNLDWDTRDFTGRYRFDFLDGFHVEPGGRYRTGDGHDDGDYEFDAYLWEGFFRMGYTKENVADASVQFSAIQMESGGDAIPYQMMSGYGEGRTYRLEANGSVDVNDFISFALHYVLRFGNAEENIFQKLSMEAKAYF